MTHDPDRNLTLHGPFARAVRIALALMFAAIITLGGMTAVALSVFTRQRQEACNARNEQIIRQNDSEDRSRAFLSDVAENMRRDGDTNTAMALDRYIYQIERQDRLEPVKCK
jgi:hypothetical protein